MPNLRKYEGNNWARPVYLKAFGEGFAAGWQGSAQIPGYYRLSYEPLFLDRVDSEGYDDGRRAGMRARVVFEREGATQKDK